MTDILASISSVTELPIFGIAVAFIFFFLAKLLSRRFDTPIINPLILSVLFIWGFYFFVKIPIQNFNSGGNIILLFLPPATAALAVSMYEKRMIIKENFIPILAGTIVGVVVSVSSILILCKAFGIEKDITMSLFPKSVTSAIAMPLAEELGGYSAIASAGVFITGVFGAIMCPYFIKWFKIDNPIAEGLGIGASCHALGTTQAIKLGRTQGATSGIAIGICGLLTVIASLFL
jgi:putative effector of murein hydrolase